MNTNTNTVDSTTSGSSSSSSDKDVASTNNIASFDWRGVASNLFSSFTASERNILKHVANTTLAIVVFTTFSFTQICRFIGLSILLLAIVIMAWLVLRVDKVRRRNFIDKLRAAASLVLDASRNKIDFENDDDAHINDGDSPAKPGSSNPYFKSVDE